MAIRARAGSRRLKGIEQTQWTAYVLIFSIFGISLLLRQDQFLAMWTIPATMNAVPAFLCHLILFLVLLALCLRWIAATAHEFDLWKEWLTTPFVSSQVYMAMYGLAVALGLMLVLVYDVTIFSAYLAGFLIFNYWTQSLANDHFRRALEQTEVTDENEHVLRIMKHYWIELPQQGRIATMAVFTTIAFIISLVNVLRESVWSNVLVTISYLILILTIVIGESVISIWRHRRDTAIQRATEPARRHTRKLDHKPER